MMMVAFSPDAKKMVARTRCAFLVPRLPDVKNGMMHWMAVGEEMGWAGKGWVTEDREVRDG